MIVLVPGVLLTSVHTTSMNQWLRLVCSGSEDALFSVLISEGIMIALITIKHLTCLPALFTSSLPCTLLVRGCITCSDLADHWSLSLYMWYCFSMHSGIQQSHNTCEVPLFCCTPSQTCLSTLVSTNLYCKELHILACITSPVLII